MTVWKIKISPNPSAAPPCHTALVRANTCDEARQIAIEDARNNDAIHEAPCATEACVATEQEARLLPANEKLRLVEYKHPMN